MDLFSSMLDGYVKGFRRIPYCYWFISVAPVRGGSLLLQRK
jgi:hypothetical protein